MREASEVWTKANATIDHRHYAGEREREMSASTCSSSSFFLWGKEKNPIKTSSLILLITP